MNIPPRWFTVVVVIALLWNLLGLFAVVSDLRITEAEVATMTEQQQALYKARPLWSVAASVVAVVGGTLGCLALLLRKRLALGVLIASLVGVLLQDIGLFLVAGAGIDPTVLGLQGLVLAIAIGLVFLARHAIQRAWIT